MMATLLFPSSVRGMATREKVAIIGGGIAGLSCAQHLANQNQFEVTVFDTGRIRPGGRCSSRQSGDAAKEGGDREYPLLSQYRYDHAAQMISVDNNSKTQQHRNDALNEFYEQQLSTWKSQGVVTKFPTDSVCRISQDGKIRPILKKEFYHGSEGMGGLALSLTNNKNFDLKQDVWVSPSSGVRYQKNTGKWKLQANGQSFGIFDKLVIAHNGKCADRIMSKTPAKDVHNLLRVNFSPTVPAHGGNKMTLNSIYSLTVCLDKNSIMSKALPDPFLSGFCDHPALRMITCQTRKYPGQNNADYEVWTILSSAKFAKKYKAPQEFLPEDTIEEVSSLLLGAVEEVFSLQNKIQLNEKRLQLWGAAVPLNVWENKKGFIYDPRQNVGVCGDWLVEPSIAGAWASGRLLAHHMLENPKDKTGLDGKFERSEGASKLGIASL